MARVHRICLVLFLFASMGTILLFANVDRSTFAEDSKANNDVVQNLVIGPFPLISLWRGKKGVEVFGTEVGERENEIRHILAGCQIFLIDKRMRREGRWSFLEVQDYPKVAMNGPYYYEIKGDALKNDFIVQLRTIDVAVSSTDHDASPPWRKGSIMGELMVKGTFGHFKSGTFQLMLPFVMMLKEKVNFNYPA